MKRKLFRHVKLVQNDRAERSAFQYRSATSDRFIATPKRSSINGSAVNRRAGCKMHNLSTQSQSYIKIYDRVTPKQSEVAMND